MRKVQISDVWTVFISLQCYIFLIRYSAIEENKTRCAAVYGGFC